MRAISTVLDVSLFLLLVSAAVGTMLYAPAPVESNQGAGETASVLATTTATVTYDLQHQSREAHGTVATLLGQAAVANASLHGATLTPMTSDFRSAVRAAIHKRLRAPNRTYVTAVWQPYRNASLTGRVAVGTPPPGGVDVALSTVTVPAPTDATETTTAARLSGYRALSLHTARSVTATLLPSTAFDAAATQERPITAVSLARYEAVANILGVSVGEMLEQGEFDTAHETVTRALAREFEREMSGRFRSPTAARDALQSGRVTITVRRWGQ